MKRDRWILGALGVCGVSVQRREVGEPAGPPAVLHVDKDTHKSCDATRIVSSCAKVRIELVRDGLVRDGCGVSHYSVDARACTVSVTE